MDIGHKLSILREHMEQKKMTCLMLTPSADLEYLTGFNGISLERPFLLFVTMKKAFFIVPAFEKRGMKESIRNTLDMVWWEETEDPYGKAWECLREEAVGEIAVGNAVISRNLFALQQKMPECRFVSAGNLMEEIRAVKDEEEFRKLRNATKLAEESLMEVFSSGLEGRTEYQAGHLLKNLLEEKGLLMNPGVGLVASGKNSSLPHHRADREKVIEKGDAVFFDFGCRLDGYCSDITRTVCVGKVPDEEFRTVYDTVKQANEAVFQNVRPGMTGAQADRIARALIEEAGYGAYFTHRTGHGIGIEYHEEPYIVGSSNRILTAGNVFSDEPGIYIPGKYGVRIEDCLFLRADGAERLCHLEHELLIVD